MKRTLKPLIRHLTFEVEVLLSLKVFGFNSIADFYQVKQSIRNIIEDDETVPDRFGNAVNEIQNCDQVLQMFIYYIIDIIYPALCKQDEYDMKSVKFFEKDTDCHDIPESEIRERNFMRTKYYSKLFSNQLLQFISECIKDIEDRSLSIIRFFNDNGKNTLPQKENVIVKLTRLHHAVREMQQSVDLFLLKIVDLDYHGFLISDVPDPLEFPFTMYKMLRSGVEENLNQNEGEFKKLLSDHRSLCFYMKINCFDSMTNYLIKALKRIAEEEESKKTKRKISGGGKTSSDSNTSHKKQKIEINKGNESSAGVRKPQKTANRFYGTTPLIERIEEFIKQLKLKMEKGLYFDIFGRERIHV